MPASTPTTRIRRDVMARPTLPPGRSGQAQPALRWATVGDLIGHEGSTEHDHGGDPREDLYQKRTSGQLGSFFSPSPPASSDNPSTFAFVQCSRTTREHPREFLGNDVAVYRLSELGHLEGRWAFNSPNACATAQ